jgi:hypothetical protein
MLVWLAKTNLYMYCKISFDDVSCHLFSYNSTIFYRDVVSTLVNIVYLVWYLFHIWIYPVVDLFPKSWSVHDENLTWYKNSLSMVCALNNLPSIYFTVKKNLMIYNLGQNRCQQMPLEVWMRIIFVRIRNSKIYGCIFLCLFRIMEHWHYMAEIL